MKLTAPEIEAMLTAAWGRQAYVNRYRLAGNRDAWVAEDHNGHHLNLDIHWCRDGKVRFESTDGTWPEPPDPADAWAGAVVQAMQLALVYFVEEGNRAAVKRLPSALAIAERRDWEQVGDEAGTWLIPSSSKPDLTYRVNGRCTCPDYRRNHVPGGWCKHRLARALAMRAVQILEHENGAEGAQNTPAPDPEGSNEDLHSITDPATGQARRIDLIVAYRADNAKVLPLTNGNGELIQFKVNGQSVEPPVLGMNKLYRWLQTNAYVPAGFKWLGWDHGLRRRLQTYTPNVSDDRDTALPVQHSRGRAKLFKEETR